MARVFAAAQSTLLPLTNRHSVTGTNGAYTGPARPYLPARPTLGPPRSILSAQGRNFLGTNEALGGGSACALTRGSHSSAGPVAVSSLGVAASTAGEQPIDESNGEMTPVKKGKRIAMFVEPSPFAYICGYKNRFQNLIRFLREQGDEVLVVTTHHGAPAEWYGAKVVPSWSFPCPFYPILPLSLAASPRIFNYVKNFQPDLIHVSTPGIMCFGALLIAKLLSIPIVMSYHTHVPKYIPQYTFSFLVEPMWAVIRFLHNAATLTLATSEEMRKEMVSFGAAAVSRIKVWRKGVDAELFHPRYASAEWRSKLSEGQPERPLIVHVGRLGAEKNLPFLKDILARIPEARLAFVGDGPARPELEALFHGTPTLFTGMLSGEDLSAAYASADAFFTPSESETLGFVVLEAMASGTPVVAARAGGIPDIVDKDGETGFLYTPGDVDDAVGKLRRLLFDQAFNAQMAEAGRADVEHYDWRASTRQVSEDGYNTALRLWQQSRKATGDWLPWWTKKAEWQA